MQYVIQNSLCKDKFINKNKEWSKLDDANIYFSEEIFEYYFIVDIDVAALSNAISYKNILQSLNS